MTAYELREMENALQRCGLPLAGCSTNGVQNWIDETMTEKLGGFLLTAAGKDYVADIRGDCIAKYM